MEIEVTHRSCVAWGGRPHIEYTMAGEGRRLGLFVHHTGADREFVYDRNSHVGSLDKALDQVDANGWIIVDMETDWNRIFSVE